MLFQLFYKEKIMFGLFKKSSPVQKLEKKYKQLTEEAYRLSHTDRKASDLKLAEADEILRQIKELENVR
jgi:hypothetical protein